MAPTWAGPGLFNIAVAKHQKIEGGKIFEKKPHSAEKTRSDNLLAQKSLLGVKKTFKYFERLFL